MLLCPRCGEDFACGYPCVHELILKLLLEGKWKCARCGQIIVSNQQLVELSNEQMEEVIMEYLNANL